MSGTKQQEHKTCNLIPVYATASGTQFKCKYKCGRSLLYINKEILSFTPYKLEEVRYHLFHQDWEWNKPCDYAGCEYLK